MTKIPQRLQQLDESLKALEKAPGFANVQQVIDNTVNLLGVESQDTWKLFNDSQGKIRSNAGWFMEADGFADKKATYKIAEDNDKHLDLKAFWVKKISKSITSWLVALTPNFEDEPFYGKLNVGIDFIIPEKADRVIVVLSKNYVLRTLELHGHLSVTQQDILASWLAGFDFENKSQVHEVLWQSFDIEPVNKKFYKDISGFFIELKQYLSDDKKIFDDQHAAFFANRLIGRIIFCWFLDKKGIINADQSYFDPAGLEAGEYYRKKLEILFFEVFNTPLEARKIGIDDKTPFLNGGLFEAKQNDKYGDHSLTFPADYFERFFEFLGHYNFTTDESTSTFQQVAIDPEMLGRIFENLLAEQVEETGEQARKAKGAFYTPREIVDYMCRESLREYLKSQLPDHEERDTLIGKLIDTKDHDWRDQQRNYRRDLQNYKYDILKALDNAKIIDPACGSGAFPMGMLHLLLQIYERIDATFDPYKKKLGIIKNNLYGVDIEPMAVELSRLRAWLSIIVDEHVDSSKIEPLPNLDFKFVCANSLMPLESDEGQQAMFDTANLAEDMQEIRDQYYSTKSTKKKATLQGKFEKILKGGQQSMLASSREKQLRSYHPFDGENSTEFFDPEFMFGVKGFDIVIANPPYGAKLPENQKQFLKKQYSYFIQRIPNSYQYFLALQKDLACKDGVVVNIIPNEFLFQIYMTNSRRYLLDYTQFLMAVNLGDNMFGAVVPTCVISFKNKEVEKGYNISIADLREVTLGEISNHLVTNKFPVISSEVIKSFPNSAFSFDIEKSNLIAKLQDHPKFIDFCEDVANGISTSHDKVYFISKEEAKSLDLETLHSKQCLKGGDIQKFYIPKEANNVVLYIDKHFSVDSAPNIYSYLKKHKEDLIEKSVEKKQGKRKWEILFRSRDPKLFENPKILFRQTGDSVVASYDPNGKFYCIDSLNSAPLQKPYHDLGFYFLGILNSSLINFFYREISQEGGRILAQVKPSRLKVLPMVINKDFVSKITDLSIEITNQKSKNKDTKTEDLEREINKIVYQIYKLTPEEIELVEESLKK